MLDDIVERWLSSHEYLGECLILMDLDSPRWKQLFAYLTQSKTEAELDAVMAGMTLEGYCDRRRDRFADKPLRHPGQVVYIEAHSAGPNSATVVRKRKWYES